MPRLSIRPLSPCGGLFALFLVSCGKQYTEVPVVAVKKAAAPYVMPDEKAVFAQYAGAMSCAGCHPEQFAKWNESHHGLAERKPDAKLDEAAFVPGQSFKHGSQTTEAAKKDGIMCSRRWVLGTRRLLTKWSG